MTRFIKYILGLGIVSLLLVVILYYAGQKEDNKYNTVKSIEEDDSSSKDFDSNKENINSLSESQDYNNTELQSAIIKLLNQYYDINSDIDTDILAYKSKKDLQEKIDMFTVKKQAIEAYDNLSYYIKPGLSNDSYVVFTTYDIKLKNIKTKVPGMSVLTVIKNDEGKLLINISSNEEGMNDYIKKLVDEKEINEIIEDVNKRLATAIKKDSSLNKFVDFLKET